MGHPHILVVTFPSQGHINPGLQLAKRLVTLGLKVTFATTISTHRRMSRTDDSNGLLSFATFSDGHDDGYNLLGGDFAHCLSELTHYGQQTFPKIILRSAKDGHPVTCIIYSLLVSWVAKVARDFHLPSIFLWNQPATVLDVYYHYFHGYEGAIEKSINSPTISVNLPGLPPLRSSDLPSFFSPKSNTKLHGFALPALKEHFHILDAETNPRILVNTFDELEHEALNSIKKYNLIGVGPLIPSAFLDEKDPSDTSFGADLVQGSNSYTEWLDSKPKSSVIYISFGSIAMLSEKQMEETAKALIDIDRPFLWVMRENDIGVKHRKELQQKGIIVDWCCQVEVLSHPSVGCFVTHCGWNSTMESFVSGVPVVALPQWSDQGTNAKLVTDVWMTGIRMVPNERGIFEGEQLKKGVQLVMGEREKAKEMRKNARKWKDLARDAVKEGGTSDKNLKTFLDEIIEGC
ncbi:UDP-glycosyltransferase 75C1 [Ricinus communis]|uniref:UDP-glycosyltransferase 75C1 n=1 Tax=Ricinus communis TaxID=3988 RepID=UPI00201A69F9|nr:UDP-glycosyltransferase 75C1 [Ricinus communis]